MPSPDNCRLCLSVKPLRKSHIIPEFLYRPLYDEKHRIDVLSTRPNQPNKPIQKGIYEKLLCGDCEQKLSIWERYASRLLNGGVDDEVGLISHRKGNSLHLSGIDYLKFRLFQLSILWRASISSHRFFQHVQLGHHHEELIRELLVSDKPGHSWQYGCLMTAITYKDAENNQVLTDLIYSPEPLKIEGHTMYRFIFGGFVWLYFASSHKPPRQFFPGLLTPEGNAVILIRNIDDLKFLKDLATDIFSAYKRGSA